MGVADLVYPLNFVESFAFGSLISAVDPVATLAIFQVNIKILFFYINFIILNQFQISYVLLGWIWIFIPGIRCWSSLEYVGIRRVNIEWCCGHRYVFTKLSKYFPKGALILERFSLWLKSQKIDAKFTPLSTK